jgi:colicin import membrane protein
MIRKNESGISVKAGVLAVAVHVVLLGAILLSVNWKAAHPDLNVTEVELWDKLPGQSAAQPPALKVQPKPEPPKVEEPKLEPKPVLKEEPKPEPKPKPLVEKVEEPKVDIELEKKKKELAQIKAEALIEEKQKIQQAKKEKSEQQKQLAAIQNESREEDVREKEQALQAKKAAKAERDALKKLQQEALADDKAEGDKQASAARSAANAGIIAEYKNKIRAKIQRNVNKTLCSDGNPQPAFEITLMPTGDVQGSPKLTKPSGNAACDDAVERAILQSQPLPLPDDADLFSQFRNLNLKFKPND